MARRAMGAERSRSCWTGAAGRLGLRSRSSSKRALPPNLAAWSLSQRVSPAASQRTTRTAPNWGLRYCTATAVADSVGMAVQPERCQPRREKMSLSAVAQRCDFPSIMASGGSAGHAGGGADEVRPSECAALLLGEAGGEFEAVNVLAKA